jgi:hypothetical protein
MSDAYAVWAAAAGLSKQKSVTLMWPELAAALGGTAAPGAPADPEAPPPEPQPLCSPCFDRGDRDRRNVLAIGRVDGVPVCGWCVGTAPFRGKKLRRVAHWKVGRAKMADDDE